MIMIIFIIFFLIKQLIIVILQGQKYLNMSLHIAIFL